MWRRAFIIVWPAALVWVVATTVLVASVRAAGFSPFRTDTWVRWDSDHYLDIAQHGYTLVRCPPPRQAWCGDAGWFPAYPWLVAAIHGVGANLYQTAVALSWLLSLGTIALLWTTFLERRRTLAGILVLVYAAFAPGQVYEYAVFPLSLLALATLAHLWLLTRDRWLAAGLAGAVAALAYPVGVVAAPAATIWLLFVRREARWWVRLSRTAVVAGITVLGLAVVPLIQKIQVGRWDAYLLVQRGYGHSLRDPFGPIGQAVAALARGSASAPQLQTLLVTFVLASVLVELSLRRFRVPAGDLLLALWVSGAWLLPHLQANVSVYRSEAALLPMAPLLRRLPRPLLATVAAAAIVLAVPMARGFVRRQLV
jgi:hypothetical protein